MSEHLWRAIKLLGRSSPEERLEFLREMIEDEGGGTRNAAATALGEVGDLPTLAERLKCETNKFVVATIKAHLRRAINAGESSFEPWP